LTADRRIYLTAQYKFKSFPASLPRTANGRSAYIMSDLTRTRGTGGPCCKET
jgi:hypothetical protein